LVVQFVQNRWVKSRLLIPYEKERSMAIPRLLTIALLLSLIPATAFAAVATHSPHQASASSTKLSSLSINVSGNATTIGDRATPSVPTTQMIPALVSGTPEASSQTFHATVTVSSKVVNQNDAVVRFNITSVTLKIGSTTYTGTNGTGIFNQQSLVVVVHATVTSGSTSGMLILIGHAGASLTTSGSTTLTFSSPQSKLASSDFLSLTGKLTVS
jgi:hypothetical protein